MAMDTLPMPDAPPAIIYQLPKSYLPMEFTDHDLDVCTRTVWGEARGEPVEGQVAVSWVIRNRAENPSWWGKTPADVCFHKWQFSCWNATGDQSQACRLEALKPDDSAYERIALVVKSVFVGLYPDPTHGATHYKVKGTPAQWDKSCADIAPVEIGHHQFFNLGPNA